MAEKVVIDLAIETGRAAKNLGQLEEAAENLTELLKETDIGTKEFEELNQELIKVNKQIKNTELSMEALDNEGVASQIGAVAGAVGDMTAGFMLLGGDDDSALAETARRIETALGVSMAFKGAIEGVSAARKLWNNVIKTSTAVQRVNNIVTSTGVVIMKLLGKTAQTTSKGFKILKGALMGLGIGLILTAVQLLVENFSFLVNGIQSAVNGFKKLGIVAKLAMLPLWPLIVLIEAVKKSLQDLGLIEGEEEKARKERAKAQKKRLEEEKKLRANRILQIENNLKREQAVHDQRMGMLDNEIAIQKSLGKSTIDLEREKLKAAIEFHKTQKPLIEESIALKRKDLELEIAKLENSRELAKQVGLETAANKKLLELKDQLSDLDNEQIKSTQAIQNAETQLAVFENNIATEKRKNNKKASEDRKKEIEKEEQARFDLLIAQKEADAEEIQNEREKAEALINIERLKQERLLENKELSDAEIELLEFEHLERIAEISQAAIDKELEQEQAKADAQAEIDKQAFEDKKALDEAQIEFNQKVLESEQALQDAKLDAAKGLIAGLTELAGENEKIANALFIADKALAIGEIIINTQREIAGIFASYSAIPGGQAIAAPLVAAAKIRAATGIATIVASSIAKFKGGGGASIGGAGGGSIAGAGATAPTIAPVTNTSTLVPQEPQQVFVTETDITNTQNQVAVIETQATIK
jgi:hypothetical protein